MVSKQSCRKLSTTYTKWRKIKKGKFTQHYSCVMVYSTHGINELCPDSVHTFVNVSARKGRPHTLFVFLGQLECCRKCAVDYCTIVL